MSNEKTTLEKIQNQINNKEALSKFIQPTGTSQEYTPVINFSELGFDLLNTISVQLEAKNAGLSIINGDEVKMVYNQLNCVTNYENSECFSELHDGIQNTYKSILKAVVSNALASQSIDKNDQIIFLDQIEEMNKNVNLRTEKPRIKLKA